MQPPAPPGVSVAVGMKVANIPGSVAVGVEDGGVKVSDGVGVVIGVSAGRVTGRGVVVGIFGAVSEPPANFGHVGSLSGILKFFRSSSVKSRQIWLQA